MMCPNLCDVLIALLIRELPCFERMIRDASRIQPFAKRAEAPSNGFLTRYGMGIEVVGCKPLFSDKRMYPFEFRNQIGVRQFLCGLGPHLL